MTAEFKEAEEFYKRYENMRGTEEEWTAAAQDMVDTYNRCRSELMKNLLLAVFDTLSARQKERKEPEEQQMSINF